MLCEYNKIKNMCTLKTFLKDNDYSNPQYGFMDENGNVVIKPQFFWALDFDESGYARVWANEDDSTYSLIDRTGKIVHKTPYTDIEDFDGGYAIVKKENLFGIVDTNYKEVVPCRFEEAYFFENYETLLKNK